MSVTTVRLQTEVEQHLEAIADRLNRSKSWVINQALSEYIEKQQLEQERWKQTLEAMESAAQGKVADAARFIAGYMAGEPTTSRVRRGRVSEASWRGLILAL